MITQILTSDELKQILSESFFNKTQKVTKIADDSNLNGFFFGLGKVAQKAMTEIAIVESHLLPESAEGEQLDIIAERLSLVRFQDSKSTTYVRVVGSVGTYYEQGVHKFTSVSGITFDLEEDLILDEMGYGYIKVSSVETGIKCNVDPLQITKINPIPVGHQYCINEFKASGGRDVEDDSHLLKRIKECPNIIAQDTLSKITQNLIKINSNVLRVIYQGTNGLGKNVLSVLSINGASFTILELQDFNSAASRFLSMVDLKTYEENSNGVIFTNPTWYPIDISFRAKLDPAYNPDDIRKNIQIKCSNILNLLYWNNNKIIEWEDFLLAAKSTKGVDYIADNYFYPKVDIKLPRNVFPRIRGFQILDLDGNLIVDISGKLNPYYYPNKIDFNYQNLLK